MWEDLPTVCNSNHCRLVLFFFSFLQLLWHQSPRNSRQHLEESVIVSYDKAIISVQNN